MAVEELHRDEAADARRPHRREAVADVADEVGVRRRAARDEQRHLLLEARDVGGVDRVVLLERARAGVERVGQLKQPRPCIEPRVKCLGQAASVKVQATSVHMATVEESCTCMVRYCVAPVSFGCEVVMAHAPSEDDLTELVRVVKAWPPRVESATMHTRELHALERCGRRLRGNRRHRCCREDAG